MTHGSLTHLHYLNFRTMACARYYSDDLKWRAEEKMLKRARRESQQDQGTFSLVSP